MEESCRPIVFLEVQRQTTKNIKENFGVQTGHRPNTWVNLLALLLRRMT